MNLLLDLSKSVALARVTTRCLVKRPKIEPNALRRKPSLRVLRRLERIEKLPQHQQNTLLKTIDGFLKGVAS
jgi:hypothetical protein